MQSLLTLRQIYVRDTLYSLAAAIIAALVLAALLPLGVAAVLGVIGHFLLVTALAQAALSWIAQLCDDLNGALGTALGGVSSLTTAGILLIVNGAL